MFCGLIIKPSQKVKLDPTQGEILHLSQACLSEPKDNGRVYVQAIENNKAITICSLQKGTIEHASLDLFLSTGSDIELSVIGKNEVHISGFYEPDMHEEDEFDDEDAMIGVSDEEEEEVKDGSNRNLKRKIQHSEDSTEEDLGEDEEIDSDEADELDLENLMDDEDNDEDEDNNEDDEDDEDGDSEKEEPPVPIKNTNKQSSTSQKTKKSEVQEPVKKKVKPDSTQNKADQAYENSIIEFLKKNGRTNLAMIGNKIKKPEGVTKKLGAFIAERCNLFKVENNMISLIK
ncbi:uncharacterized protein CMU_010120 [Cryptosporidium muris RN66]|uniref:Nucleoplasmin-like domain-containing protein n=1 Tax=Cryptosporidium muris (strain RN66) TaxID=441375 RepID=B6AE79_CRYMR|nr:uncharacterized protein CMU_010120 [Cryptosporidium muris RN66]EEA06520.1 hypothetical protein, conserved [Cryptosporidium muris RN66]|eukprot:XP_002140869.1 hypothetical protein [Cryptosporidium muris RN66]